MYRSPFISSDRGFITAIRCSDSRKSTAHNRKGVLISVSVPLLVIAALCARDEAIFIHYVLISDVARWLTLLSGGTTATTPFNSSYSRSGCTLINTSYGMVCSVKSGKFFSLFTVKRICRRRSHFGDFLGKA
uniref:Uncharacterized protein n=1 Tax=Salmonella sp. TaxID=599 RepID=A0A482ET84_SALSP|nr:hypothetical protein NNIBIDOC_00063 [Salmonella sp.]